MATRSSLARFDADSFRRDDATGDLHAKVNPTRAGVFMYRNADGTTRRELRPRSEVHKAESMRLLNGKPTTDDHPIEGGKLVLLDAQIAEKHRTGIVFNHDKAADGLHTEADVIITNKRQAALVEAGKRAVSCGYKCDEDWTPGIDPEFGPYDLIQTNIRYNHLAIVAKGRAGDGARLRADSDEPCARFDAEEIDPDEPDAPTPPNPDPKEKPKMAKIRVDHDSIVREFDVPDDAADPIVTKFRADADTIKTLTARATDAEQKLSAVDQSTKDYDALKAKYDAAVEKLDAFEKEQEKVRLDSVKQRLLPILGKDYAFAGKSEAELNAAALAKAKPAIKLDGLSPEYIAARVDAVLEDQPATPPAGDGYGKAAARVDSHDLATSFSLVD